VIEVVKVNMEIICTTLINSRRGLSLENRIYVHMRLSFIEIQYLLITLFLQFFISILFENTEFFYRHTIS